MRPLSLLLFYLITVFVGGALVAPWLYFSAQNLAGQFPALANIASSPFHRYVNRSLIVFAVIGLVPLLRGLGIKTWCDLGFGGEQKGKNWLMGFLLGLVSLAFVAGVAVAVGARELNLSHEPARFIRHLFNATLAAVVVSVLEEFIFRGGVFGGLRKTVSWKTALIVSSAVYALVHFFARPAPPESINWATGLFVLGQMLRGFTDFQTLIPAFLNLLLAGMILGIAFQFTRSLYLSIGLHAGWIFWLKSYGFLTRETAGANVWLWGTGKLIDGWMALFILTIVLLLVWKVGKRQSRMNTNKHE
ncbi:MAG: CPBP family intramembrane metalloprotease [Verrucomicrobia bacterium]|nr:CPBP family intramembrane metalloprotease [Verrucomicrobiota bacterium]